MEEAVKLGADAVGGIPHFEYTREKGVSSVHFLMDLAEKYDRLVDVHCDEIDDPASRFLEVLADEDTRTRYGGTCNCQVIPLQWDFMTIPIVTSYSAC